MKFKCYKKNVFWIFENRFVFEKPSDVVALKTNVCATKKLFEYLKNSFFLSDVVVQKTNVYLLCAKKYAPMDYLF